MSLWVCRKLMHVRWLFGISEPSTVWLSSCPRSCKQVKRWNPRWGDGPGGRCRNVEPKPAWTYNITQFVDECWCFFCSWVWKWCSSPEMICICNPDPWVVLYYNTSLLKYIYIVYVHMKPHPKEPSRGRIHPAFNGGWNPKLGGHGAVTYARKWSSLKLRVRTWKWWLEDEVFFLWGEGGCCGCCF